MEPSSRDRKIIEIARREVSREHIAEFAPIVKGPIVAIVALSGLAMVAGVYMVFNRLKSLVGQGSDS